MSSEPCIKIVNEEEKQLLKDKWQQVRQYVSELISKFKVGKNEDQLEKESEYINQITLDQRS